MLKNHAHISLWQNSAQIYNQEIGLHSNNQRALDEFLIAGCVSHTHPLWEMLAATRIFPWVPSKSSCIFLPGVEFIHEGGYHKVSFSIDDLSRARWSIRCFNLTRCKASSKDLSLSTLHAQEVTFATLSAWAKRINIPLHLLMQNTPWITAHPSSGLLRWLLFVSWRQRQKPSGQAARLT